MGNTHTDEDFVRKPEYTGESVMAKDTMYGWKFKTYQFTKKERDRFSDDSRVYPTICTRS